MDAACWGLWSCSVDAVGPMWLFCLIPNHCSGVLRLEDQRKLQLGSPVLGLGKCRMIMPMQREPRIRSARRSFSAGHGTWQPCLSRSWDFGPVQSQSAGGRWGSPPIQPHGQGCPALTPLCCPAGAVASTWECSPPSSEPTDFSCLHP